MIVTGTMSLKAAKALGLELDALTSASLGAAYKAKAKLCHPDIHHEPALWAEISWAKEVLLIHLEKQRIGALKVGDCRACEGLGRVQTSAKSFGRGLTMMCVMCRGSGYLGDKE
jgi:DnaJ-class molecular chaperone